VNRIGFDLLEHDGADLRDLPLLERKRRLAEVLGRDKRQVIQHRLRPPASAPQRIKV
jgi:ATP-dependent DNA ligase